MFLVFISKRQTNVSKMGHSNWKKWFIEWKSDDVYQKALQYAFWKWRKYQKTLSIIKGFEDFGNFGRSGKKADHTLVFMVHGLTENFKQPVSISLMAKEKVPSLLISFYVFLLSLLNW